MIYGEMRWRGRGGRVRREGRRGEGRGWEEREGRGGVGKCSS